MKLDFVDTEAESVEDSRLIRLYDFSCDEVALIHLSVLELASGLLNEIAVHRLPYVELAGVKLTLRPAAKDFGICPTVAMSEFECRLTADTWVSVAGYMEPFLSSCDSNTFQWLNETFHWTKDTSDIGFLFSPHPEGAW
jgi:hypothetical protein